MDSCKHEKMKYAKAYIKPQIYCNLFSIDDGFKKGTIFMELYCPFKEKK